MAADRSMVSALVGCKAMPLAVVDETNGSVDLVPNGAAIRINITA